MIIINLRDMRMECIEGKCLIDKGMAKAYSISIAEKNIMVNGRMIKFMGMGLYIV